MPVGTCFFHDEGNNGHCHFPIERPDTPPGMTAALPARMRVGQRTPASLAHHWRLAGTDSRCIHAGRRHGGSRSSESLMHALVSGPHPGTAARLRRGRRDGPSSVCTSLSVGDSTFRVDPSGGESSPEGRTKIPELRAGPRLGPAFRRQRAVDQSPSYLQDGCPGSFVVRVRPHSRVPQRARRAARRGAPRRMGNRASRAHRIGSACAVACPRHRPPRLPQRDHSLGIPRRPAEA